jgi:hypothetical protein
LGYVLADLSNLASYIAAEDVRQLHPGKPFPDPDIEVIHGACFYADQDLIFAGLRIRNIFVAEHFGPAKFMNADGFHI